MKPTAAPTLLYRLHLEDELPTIGSGHRWVYAREGHKWVFVLCPFTANTVRTPIARWRSIKQEPWAKGDFIREYLRGRLKSLGREPTAFELSALEA